MIEHNIVIKPECVAGNQMKDVDEYIQLNYSNCCDLLILGFTFVNEKLSVRY